MLSNDIKGVCLFLGLIGMAYAALLIILVAFTGVKIVKSILFIVAMSAALFSMGLRSQVKQRIFMYAKTLLIK
ncbi:hypothetical protein PVT67_08285 [Gallaecimonas kandeliae]|uniref:hypothetical protein n=1 Tax=Gallaecimonas kandeliae TaxID=3029055 RepID=UPI00264949B9|nr:hypothetical protein [Gallaecimonas kandeliae]WKE67220.1 hypothetical protein PVT67_08285 [Gallaecimonas kandeliae]